MRVQESLNKAICHFDGGFGYAFMDTDGEAWSFTVKTVTLDQQGNMKLLAGKEVASNVTVREHGIPEMFGRAFRKLYDTNQKEVV